MDDEQDYEQWIDAMEYHYEHLRELYGRDIVSIYGGLPSVRNRSFGTSVFIDEPEQEKLIIIGGE